MTRIRHKNKSDIHTVTNMKTRDMFQLSADNSK